MTPHETPDSHSGEALLREIAQREQELQRQVADARAEAAGRIEQAQRQAEEMRARARDRARDAAAGAAAEASREAERIANEILARAASGAAGIRKQAEERRAEAVKLVVREVLGGQA
ncbi:MAG TPA: V-type ATPase subunit subunit G family protein [bacterium]|nr:V-type ATPase subunit subunit G family protein [bacterium]